MLPRKGSAAAEWRVFDEPIQYPDAVAAMEDRVAAIAAGEGAEAVWLLEHPPLYTAGTSARESDLLAPDRFPVFNLLVEEGRFYGLPVFGVPGFKFGKYHHFEETVDPDRVMREPRRDDEELLRGFAARYFPGGSGPTMSMAVCMFTNTSDNHFVIDLHPDYPQVSFASPCSGHGFKFASVIGEIMADLAERGTTRHNIELFRLDRLLGGEREPAAGRGAGRPRTPSLGTAADQRPNDHRT